MEELLHIPYGACIITANGETKNSTLFFGNDIHDSFSHFYRFFSDLTETEVAYLYFITVDSNNLPVVQPGIIYDLFSANGKNNLLSLFYAQYGIYAYSVTKGMPIYSFRVKHLSKNPADVFSVIHDLHSSAVAPSHITEVLESMNEKTSA